MPKFNRLLEEQKDEGDLRVEAMIAGMKTVLESLSDSSWWLLNDLCEWVAFPVCGIADKSQLEYWRSQASTAKSTR